MVNEKGSIIKIRKKEESKSLTIGENSHIVAIQWTSMQNHNIQLLFKQEAHIILTN